MKCGPNITLQWYFTKLPIFPVNSFIPFALKTHTGPPHVVARCHRRSINGYLDDLSSRQLPVPSVSPWNPTRAITRTLSVWAPLLLRPPSWAKILQSGSGPAPFYPGDCQGKYSSLPGLSCAPFLCLPPTAQTPVALRSKLKLGSTGLEQSTLITPPSPTVLFSCCGLLSMSFARGLSPQLTWVCSPSALDASDKTKFNVQLHTSV